MYFQFRPLSLKDLPLLHKWFKEEHIRLWHNNHQLSKSGLWAKYLPRIQGDDPVFCYIVAIHGMPIGFIQYYNAKLYATAPQLKNLFEMGFKNKAVASIDWFLANTPFLGKGYSQTILKQFLKDILFKDFDIALVDPQPSNAHAIKSYEKAGFTTLKVLELSKAEKIQLMILFKENLMPPSYSKIANANITAPSKEDDDDVFYIDE